MKAFYYTGTLVWFAAEFISRNWVAFLLVYIVAKLAGQ